MFNYHPTRQRQILNSIKAAYSKGGTNAKGRQTKPGRFAKDYNAPQTLSMGYLLQSQVLNNTSAQYTFTFDGSANSAAPGENLLNRNDAFHATGIELLIGAWDIYSPGATVWHTYPDAISFQPASGFNPAHLETLYNGQLRYQMANTVFVDSLSTVVFRYVPEAQTAPDTNYAPNNQILRWLKSGYQFGCGVFPTDPMINLFGNQKNQLTLTFPSFTGMQWASAVPGVEHRIAIRLTGYLATSVIKN